MDVEKVACCAYIIYLIKQITYALHKYAQDEVPEVNLGKKIIKNLNFISITTDTQTCG